MLFCGQDMAAAKQMVLCQEVCGSVFIADITQQNKYGKGNGGQGDKLGYPRNHKGKAAAEEHVIAGQSHKTDDDLAVYHMN